MMYFLLFLSVFNTILVIYNVRLLRNLSIAQKCQSTQEVQIIKENSVIYYPTIYSSTDQLKRRARDISNNNLSENFRGYSEWTQAEDKALRSEWLNDKLTLKQIADLHQRSVGAIEKRIKLLRLHYAGRPLY